MFLNPKFDIKNDLKDILANIIPKEPRKYRALKVFLRDIFTILNFFLMLQSNLVGLFELQTPTVNESTIYV
jgi:hypothetical protein